jgi:hypothetical protein
VVGVVPSDIKINYIQMKSSLIIILLSALIYSCGHNPEAGKSSKTLVTTQKSNSTNDTNSSIIIKDSSFYSVSFLKSLEPQKAHWKFYLDSDKFIFNTLDTILFPNLLPLNKVMFFTGKKGDLKINITVKRILLSTIDYKIEVIANSNPPAIKSGLADLSPYFFVNTRTDVIDSTAINSETTEYWDTTGDYLTSIRVGKNPDNKLLIIKVECKVNKLEINLDNCPVLTEK